VTWQRSVEWKCKGVLMLSGHEDTDLEEDAQAWGKSGQQCYLRQWSRAGSALYLTAALRTHTR
jgi:hypothetical protein